MILKYNYQTYKQLDRDNPTETQSRVYLVLTRMSMDIPSQFVVLGDLDKKRGEK
jgi:hypothetical protein